MAKKEKYYRRKEDGLYEAIRTINGKRVAFRGKSCREVDRKMLEYREKEERGRTVSEIADAWWDEKVSALSASTRSAYVAPMAYLKDELGDIPAKEVRAIQCQRLLEKAVRQGYALGSVKMRKTVIMQVFRYAVIQGDIDVSPAAQIELPRGISRKRRESLTAEQIRAVNECRTGDWWLMGLAFLWTGCRRGELMALTYEDIDRKAGTITINKKVAYSANRFELEMHTKTEAGMREIPLFSPLAEALPKDRIGLIFHNEDGTMLQSHQVSKAWAQYRKDAGLPEHITPHYFRHTFATICYNAGADAKETAAILGHANESTTMEVYTHLTSEKKAKAAEKIEAYAATV